jgi:hypothetical protein
MHALSLLLLTIVAIAVGWFFILPPILAGPLKRQLAFCACALTCTACAAFLFLSRWELAWPLGAAVEAVGIAAALMLLALPWLMPRKRSLWIARGISLLAALGLIRLLVTPVTVVILVLFIAKSSRRVLTEGRISPTLVFRVYADKGLVGAADYAPYTVFFQPLHNGLLQKPVDGGVVQCWHGWDTAVTAVPSATDSTIRFSCNIGTASQVDHLQLHR